ncbi:MAG: peptidase dimerization domain-containing protein, partial [Acidimicrobiales bacterium]
PDLLQADVAILGEPTGTAVEAGCQGVLRSEVTLCGERAHVARPWTGVNAIHRAAPLLAWLAQFEPRQPVVGGCGFRESLQAVSFSGGVSNNVVPDRATIELSYRFAPDLDVSGADGRLRQALNLFCDPTKGDEIRIVDSAPAAAPGLDHPVLASLVAASGRPVSAKLAWTDVALFTERGIPAANFGPGDPLLAHRPDERVTRTQLESAYRTLKSVLEAPRA